MIDWDKTKSKTGFGKSYFDKYPKSNKQVWSTCNVCKVSRLVYFFVSDDDTLCQTCANIKKGKDETICLKQSIAATERWKRHGEKDRISGEKSIFYGVDHSGENNPFYGKTHTDDSLEKMCGERPNQMGDGNPNYKTEIDDFIEKNQGKHFCGCGCGREIKISRKYYHSGIPEYIQGHYSKTDEGKRRIIQGNLLHKPNQRNTSIEIKMQAILKLHRYYFKTHIGVCNICRPDITFEDKKIIIQCDGDYWHNYPEGTEKDRRQDKVLIKNGWKVIRFWEHEINENIQDCFRKFEAIYNDTEYIKYGRQGTLDKWK